MAPHPKSLEERFWPKVANGDPDECWLWTAAHSDNGYGRIRVGGRDGGQRSAHRVSWELANGPVPEGAIVCHTCDVRDCVNPRHLYAGTYSDNIRDAVDRARIPEVITNTGYAMIHMRYYATVKRADGRDWKKTFHSLEAAVAWRDEQLSASCGPLPLTKVHQSSDDLSVEFPRPPSRGRAPARPRLPNGRLDQRRHPAR